MQDTNQYVLNQMAALEAEQNHIDNRAGVVERKLRDLMETGDNISITHICSFLKKITHQKKTNFAELLFLRFIGKK